MVDSTASSTSPHSSFASPSLTRAPETGRPQISQLHLHSVSLCNWASLFPPEGTKCTIVQCGGWRSRLNRHVGRQSREVLNGSPLKNRTDSQKRIVAFPLVSSDTAKLFGLFFKEPVFLSMSCIITFNFIVRPPHHLGSSVCGFHFPWG